MPPVPVAGIVNDAMYDVRPEQYTTVIREMIRHENDVTNHRIMWLLIGQGFLANAFVGAERSSASGLLMLSLAGILVTLSAFLMLYKSYQARGYLQFHSWDGRARGSKPGEGTSGYVHGLGSPVICWNPGCSCRDFS